MKSCSVTSLICCLVFSLWPGSVIAQEKKDDAHDWPKPYAPKLLKDINAIDVVTGKPVEIKRAYAMHRDDVEKIRVMKTELDLCETDIEQCETEIIEVPKETKSFFGSTKGMLLIGSAGFILGVAAAVGITFALGSAL